MAHDEQVTALRARLNTLGPVTDKFGNGYIPAYRELAARLGPAARVLEVGVHEGGSLRLWQDLFPDSPVIAGADNNETATWPGGTVRIVASQATDYLADIAAEVSPGGWDMIVDDASHDAALTGGTFERLWPQVAPGGVYVVEDWEVGYRPEWLPLFGPGMLRLAESFLTMLGPDSDLAEARYLYGMAILTKRKAS
jgi:hypothetical protein